VKLFKIAPGMLAALASVLTARAAEPEQKQKLVWDSELKEQVTKPGDTEARISFTATNPSATEIVVNDVKPSCGCTLVSMPDKPWKLAPGASGSIVAKLDLRGKSGTLIKSLSVSSSEGTKSLVFKIKIPDLMPSSAGSVDRGSYMRRVFNQLSAGADRQAVFKNDCATCHVQPAAGKMGPALFVASCGICHTAAHRASMVPELTGLPNGGNRDYWHMWISMGKEGTLMPGFSKAVGGPLTDEQINSLVEYALTLERSAGGPSSEPHTQSKTPSDVENFSGGSRGQGKLQPAKDGLDIYRKTNGQAGHEFIKTEQFIVPVGSVIVVKGLEFEPGISTLTPIQQQIVQEVFNSIEEITENTVGDADATRVSEFKKMEFEIRGYADDAGSRPANPALSEDRAKSVLGFLTNLGTPAWRLRAKRTDSKSATASSALPTEVKVSGAVVFVRTR
jgi:outer membrane protein OmpA-like peptidoglycan-associated protein